METTLVELPPPAATGQPMATGTKDWPIISQLCLPEALPPRTARRYSTVPNREPTNSLTTSS